MILNSHNSLPQSTAAKGAAATLWCLICNIAASNLLICISGGMIACLSCSSAWPYACVASQSACLSGCHSACLQHLLLLSTAQQKLFWHFGSWRCACKVGMSKYINHLRDTNISWKQQSHLYLAGNTAFIKTTTKHITGLFCLTARAEIQPLASLPIISSSLSLSLEIYPPPWPERRV